MITTSGLKSALFAADEKRMMAMLRAGADPDTIGPVGFSAVMHFASRGNVDNVQEIVRLGANVNIQETDKWTALMFACARGDIQNVVILMNNGADATLRNKDGASAMDIATKGKHDAIVEILKSYQVKGKGNLRRNH